MKICNESIEKITLANLMIKPEYIKKLNIDSFTFPLYRTMYGIISDMYNSGYEKLVNNVDDYFALDKNVYEYTNSHYKNIILSTEDINDVLAGLVEMEDSHNALAYIEDAKKYEVLRELHKKGFDISYYYDEYNTDSIINLNADSPEKIIEHYRSCLDNIKVGSLNDEGFMFMNPEDLPEAYKEKVWLWDGLIEKGTFNELCAPAKNGKSQLAIQLSYAISGGLELFGRKTSKCDVVYVDWELQDNAIYKRAQLVKEFMGEGRGYKVLDMNRFEEKELEDVLELIINYKKKNPELGLVVLDNWYSFCLGDTNAMGDTKSILLKIKRKLTKLGITVILVNHTNKVKSTNNNKTLTKQEILLAPFGSAAHAYVVDETIYIDDVADGRMVYVCGRNNETPVIFPCLFNQDTNWYFKVDYSELSAITLPEYDEETIGSIKEWIGDSPKLMKYFKQKFPNISSESLVKNYRFITKKVNNNLKIGLRNQFF